MKGEKMEGAERHCVELQIRMRWDHKNLVQ